MKHIVKTMSLVVVLSGLAVTSQAQTTVWSQNFNTLALGPYGAHTTDFINNTNTPALPANNIVALGQGGSGQAMALTFNATNGVNLNLQTATLVYAASGNTSTNLANYTLSFDFMVQGVNLVANQGLEIGVFGTNSWIFGGDALKLDLTSGFPTAQSGYQHYSIPLSTFSTSGSALLNPTDPSFSVGFGVVSYGNPMTASPEMLLVDNVAITMVPEPSTFAMLVGGLGLLAGWCRYRRVS
jgi:PEP-CTERM motif